jgi:hypothetical protein
MAGIEGPLGPEMIAIDATLERKIEAIHAYASQLAELFGSAEAMAPAVTAYARNVRPAGAEYGERVWRSGAPGTAQHRSAD